MSELSVAEAWHEYGVGRGSREEVEIAVRADALAMCARCGLEEGAPHGGRHKPISYARVGELMSSPESQWELIRLAEAAEVHAAELTEALTKIANSQRRFSNQEDSGILNEVVRIARTALAAKVGGVTRRSEDAHRGAGEG